MVVEKGVSMSGSTGNKAFGASEKPERGTAVFSLNLAQRMLPLVERIIADILECQQKSAKLTPEQDRLQRHRRELTWPERHRRYRLEEELSAVENRRLEVVDELRELGIALLDPEQGRVGFPTIVNDRRACFSWSPSEENIRFWHFADETVRRPIPQAWLKEISLT
jgi:hypothetical protein